VKNIWGQFQPQKKCWALSAGLPSVLVLLLTAFSVQPVQQKVAAVISLIGSDISAYTPKLPAKPNKLSEGGGGEDRSPLAAPKGRLPKASLKQFTPPVVVVNNPNPNLTMDPSLNVPPDAAKATGAPKGRNG
jgi:hypothetical protein